MTAGMGTTAGKNEMDAREAKREVRLGTVISDKGDKTIRVRYDFQVKHTKYGKYFRRSTVLAAHDENNEAKVGDVVEVAACRRISKSKCWRLLKVVEQRSGVEMVEV